MNYDKMTKEQLIEYIESLNENQTGKYGLIWDREKEPEKVVVDCDKYIPILKEETKKTLSNGGSNNILIEGDNFHSLSVLNYTHKESIDVIYIDPPYNTGNKDFMYNDKFIDIEDGYRHSKWLNFMEKRLILARNLLKEDGLIFISIDDNELYQLKLLCDKVYGVNNFIANIVIETANGVFGTRASQITKTFVKVKDYVLVYAKNKTSITRDFTPLYMGTNDLFDSHYSIMLDENMNKTNLLDYIKGNKELSKYFINYKLSIKLENISKLMIIDKEFNKKIIDMADKIYQDVSYSLSLPKEVEERLTNGETINYKNCIIFKTKNGAGTTRQYVPFKNSLRYSDDYNSEYRKAVAIGDLWEGFDADMKNVTKEGNIDFPNGKKPKRLIKQLIKWANTPNGIILDFFAGSGTTGQAVLELNQEDGGTRKFILCTNNENNICEEITYKRLNNVINGYEKKKGITGSLKYFKTDFVDYAGTRDQLYYDLTEKCIPMLCVKSDTYELVEKNKEYAIYSNKDKTDYSCVYFDIFGESYDKFLDKVKSIKEHKNLYIFSLSEYVNEESLNGISNYSLEPIPYKILDLYKNVVKMSKEC